MPRHSLQQMRRSRTRLVYDLLEEHELEEPQQERDHDPECILPSAHDDRRFFRCMTWLGLLACLGFTGVAIGVIVKFLADGSKLGLDVASADFALNKNSGFQECRAREPPTDPATCPDVLANLLSPAWDNRRGMASEFNDVTNYYFVSKNRTRTPGGQPVVYDWCEAVSCLDSTFTVVPSIPRGAAFGATSLSTWCSITVTLFTAVWGYESLERRRGKERACRALGDVAWYDCHGYNLCSFAWWWVSFASYVVGRAYKLPPGLSAGW
ncbi:uncharacterized protein B0T15DRAFT_513886 [Chaetomium strumarium]|uniref:Uncharacterized protein n=1 Tax=Chaetomium strumarium TaxID=1170767 RepID=A0AAJ0GPI5_9PEZI|nr:hypothetical protein B0T15DRAFT_513886 [Chaetomium strumarium]